MHKTSLSNIKFGENIVQSSAVPKNVSDFRFVALFRKQSASMRRKTRKTFGFFRPLKLGEGWANCLSELNKFDLG